MNNEAPYTKREQDAFREENKKQYESVMFSLKELKEELKEEFKNIRADMKSDRDKVGELYEDLKKNAVIIAEFERANNIIKNFSGFSTVTKFIFYIIIGIGTLWATVKTLLAADLNPLK